MYLKSIGIIIWWNESFSLLHTGWPRCAESTVDSLHWTLHLQQYVFMVSPTLWIQRTTSRFWCFSCLGNAKGSFDCEFYCHVTQTYVHLPIINTCTHAPAHLHTHTNPHNHPLSHSHTLTHTHNLNEYKFDGPYLLVFLSFFFLFIFLFSFFLSFFLFFFFSF